MKKQLKHIQLFESFTNEKTPLMTREQVYDYMGNLGIEDYDESYIKWIGDSDLFHYDDVLLKLKNNNELVSIDIPNLSSVDRWLAIDYNEELTTINFPNLSSVKGRLYIQNNKKLTTINLPNLSLIGGNIDFRKNNLPSISIVPLDIVKGKYENESDEYVETPLEYVNQPEIIEDFQKTFPTYYIYHLKNILFNVLNYGEPETQKIIFPKIKNTIDEESLLDTFRNLNSYTLIKLKNAGIITDPQLGRIGFYVEDLQNVETLTDSDEVSNWGDEF